MPRYELSEIRTDVLSALTSATSLTGWKKKVYDGEVEKYVEGAGNITGIGKSILFSWTNGEIEETTTCSFIHRVHFTLICISSHAGGQAIRREELESLYEDIHDALTGKRLSERIRPIVPEGWEIALQAHDATVMKIKFRTLFDYSVTFER